MQSSHIARSGMPMLRVGLKNAYPEMRHILWKLGFMTIQKHNQLSRAKLRSTDFTASFNFNKFVFTILISLNLALSLSNYIWPSIYKNIICSVLGLFALICLSTKLRRKEAIVYLFTGFLVTSFLVSSLIVGRTGARLYSPIIFILYNLGLALILLRGYVYSWGAYIVFYGLTIYFLLMLLAGSDPTKILTTASNVISTLMIIACLFLYIVLHVENKKIDLIPALLTIFFSIWGLGRTGIAASFMLFLGLFIVKLRANTIRKYHYIVIIISIICTYWFFDKLFMFAMDHSIFRDAILHNVQRWTRKASDPRFSYWANYFSNLDISRFIFGVNVVEDPWPEGAINEYNYHNSFINLHLQTGFMGLITMVLIFFSLFKFYRMNQVFLCLLLVLIFRSLFDEIIFFGRFDFIPFFFIFYFLKSSVSRFSLVKPLSTGAIPQRKNIKS